jgi:two-component system, OmpR family, phosphate regulon sensor histidine kinase PhoR
MKLGIVLPSVAAVQSNVVNLPRGLVLELRVIGPVGRSLASTMQEAFTMKAPVRPPNENLRKLAELIQRDRERLLQIWRTEVRRLPAARELDVPTLNDHIPELLGELTAALKAGRTESVLDIELADSPKIHGAQRLRDGFDIVEVVAEYNILKETLHSIADTEGIDVSGEPNRIINRVFDRGVAMAVDTYARQKAVEIQQRREEHLSFVMHDLKTPLAATYTAQTILEKEIPDDAKTPRLKDMLSIMRRNLGRLDTLLRAASHDQFNLVAGATGELKLTKRDIDLWALVESLIRGVRPLAEKANTEILNEIPQDFIVFADAVLLSQVFQNLLSNAIEYTKDGRITIGAEEIEGTVRCWVQDTGKGIAADRLDKVFKKLETDPQKKGMGLGLAIVKQVVELHGGDVVLESTEGKGATFTFTLPAIRSP